MVNVLTYMFFMYKLCTIMNIILKKLWRSPPLRILSKLVAKLDGWLWRKMWG
jgi:hypothetical protein